MNNPKISVIMGIYNCAPTLQEALDSLYAQTYQDFEIILCDDGSKDDTHKIAYENQQKHKNVVLLKNPQNMGLNQTLNKCLAVARGEYIARMDGDDLCMPNRFETELRFLEEHPEYAVVSSPMEYFDEEGTFMVSKGKGKITKYSFVPGTPIIHAPCMVRKEAYDKVGGYTVDKRLLRVEDYHLWFKMFKQGYNFYELEKPYYKMRDDRNAVARRNWQGRKNEAYVRHIGYKMIGLPWWCQIYVLRPIILGLMPTFIYNFLHRKR